MSVCVQTASSAPSHGPTLSQPGLPKDSECEAYRAAFLRALRGNEPSLAGACVRALIGFLLNTSTSAIILDAAGEEGKAALCTVLYLQLSVMYH